MKIIRACTEHFASAALVSVALSELMVGCATYNWAPGPNAVGTYQEASAQCSLQAKSGERSFYAQGSPGYVAGAAAGAAVGEAIREQGVFNDCMKATGWIATGKADPKAAAAANSEAQNAVAQLKACNASVRNNPKYSPISPHFLDDSVGHYTLAQMSDQNYATPSESTLAAAEGDEIQKCRDSALPEVEKLNPRAAAKFEEVNAATTELNLALIARRITWGEYAKDGQDVMDAAKAGHPIPHANIPTEAAPFPPPPPPPALNHADKSGVKRK